jgi:PAS domain S-box-containing protein
MTEETPQPPFDERWSATALKSIGDAVIATDGRGRVLFVNPVAEALTGWGEAEARGRPLAEVFVVVDEATRRPVESPAEQVLATGRVVGLAGPTLLLARGGGEVPIDDSAAPIVGGDGRTAGVVLVFRDVAEKRRAELLNERLAAVVESSDDIIASKDLDGVITSWNGGAERIFGYSAEEVVGRHVSMLMPPELVEDMPKILGRIRRGEKVDHYQTKRRRKDGAIIDVSLTVSPIRDAGGRIVGASKVGRDVTREKLAERERAEADHRKDEFLAMLAHELRNPLSAISSTAQLFGRLETEAELVWAKEVVQRQVKHLSRLIDDLLDVSRIDRGKIVLRKEALDLMPVVAGAVETVRPLVEERRHELSVSVATGGVRVEADPLRLEQILVNLLTNAAKYTEAGGRISLSARRAGGEVVVAVADDGVGIAPELLPRVFDLFIQGDRTIARSEGGLGIGLTLAKKLAEMHGGSVAAASEGVGRGSEFTLRLPAFAAAPAPPTGPEGGPAPLGRWTSRVLVVDDNLDAAASLARFLKLLGHDVRTAHDGPSALELARVHRPQIVVLDIGLPGMDGYEVARRLRMEEYGEGAVVIAASGYGKAEDRARSRAAGFDHHLVKPVDLDLLTGLFAPAAD